jgi:hypothetical protein
MVRPRHVRDTRPPEVHGCWTIRSAIIIAGPIVFDIDSTAATVIALAFGAGAAVLAVGTAWPTGIVRFIPPLLHGHAGVIVALILLPFILAFDDSTAALLSYEIVGGAGLLATLATHFESRVPGARAMMSPQAA